MPMPSLKISETLLEKTLYAADFPVLHLNLIYPYLENDPSPLTKKINHFYRRDAERLLRYAEKKLLPELAAQQSICMAQNRPWKEASVSACFEVTESTPPYLSICRKITISMDHIYTIRLSESWNRKTGIPIYLSDYFSWQKRLKKQVIHCIYTEAPSTPGSCRKLFRRHFKRSNFFLKNGCLFVYFQPGTILPKSDGFAEYRVLKDIYG